MNLYLVISIALTIAKAEKNFEIDDIPIEHFQHEDIQNDAMDVELMPRTSRSFRYYPKDHSTDSSYASSDRNLEVLFENLPESEGLFASTFGEGEYDQGFRSKREVSKKTASAAKDPLKLVRELGKPLELSVIEPEVLKYTKEENSTKVLDEGENNFLINDFIRFRRSTNGQIPSQSQNPPRNFSHDEKVVVNPQTKDNSRETRGITKEQWVRHAYPIRKDNDELTYDDNIQESTETVRVPRVHFVTEGMSGSAPAEQRYDREARARSLNREIARNLARDSIPEMDYNQPRYTRNYDPWPARGNRYSQDPRDFRDPYPYPYQRPYDPYERNDRSYLGGNKRRRIIYYATLPEIPRSVPQADYRDRYDDYDYRDRYYDDRRFSPESSYYRGRKEFYKKPNYEEKRVKKPEYPVKVTTDLNIRDVKKNPDRIYSDVTRTRYADGNDMY